jgi:prepilin-type N-terminal cleavage/methylation domain-containing protein
MRWSTPVKAKESGQDGFTLIEMLVALFILTFGLLAAGQLIALAMNSSSLARSKGAAAVVAQDRLESLADLFRQNAAAADLVVGDHGPIQMQITNPVSARAVNRFNVTWNVSVVPDTRGRVLNARLVRVTVTPIGAGVAANSKASQNKIVSVSGIFSPRAN